MHLTWTQEWHNLEILSEQFIDANITELKLFNQVKTISDQSNNYYALWEWYQKLFKAEQFQLHTRAVKVW